MGLIYCPDCNHEISEHSLYCVHCGCPASYYDTKNIVKSQTEKKVKAKGKHASVVEEKAPITIATESETNRTSTKNGMLIPIMLTINEASKASGFSTYALKQMIYDEKIVYIKCGTKYLINMDSLVCYLDGANYQLEYIRDYYKTIGEHYNPDNFDAHQSN